MLGLTRQVARLNVVSESSGTGTHSNPRELISFQSVGTSGTGHWLWFDRLRMGRKQDAAESGTTRDAKILDFRNSCFPEGESAWKFIEA